MSSMAIRQNLVMAIVIQGPVQDSRGVAEISTHYKIRSVQMIKTKPKVTTTKYSEWWPN